MLFAFVLGLALAVSVLHAYFRDVAPILSAALLPWFFLSPVFFDPRPCPQLSTETTAIFVLEWVNPCRAVHRRRARRRLRRRRWLRTSVLVYIVVAAAIALAGGLALFRRMQGELAVVV